MKGFIHLIVPPEDFELTAGKDALATYRFNTGVAKHHFCKTCGIHAFYEPRSHLGWFDANVRCLDGAVRCLDGDVLSRFVVKPFDGRHWEENVDRIRA